MKKGIKINSRKSRENFTKFSEAAPVHIALSLNPVSHLVFLYINPALLCTSYSQKFCVFSCNLHCFTLNLISLYMLAKITFVCFPRAVSHCKPLFNLLFTTSPESFFFFLFSFFFFYYYYYIFFIVLSKHYLPSMVYLCFRLFPLSIWLLSFHYWTLFCLVFHVFSSALVSSLGLPVLFLCCHLNNTS